MILSVDVWIVIVIFGVGIFLIWFLFLGIIGDCLLFVWILCLLWFMFVVVLLGLVVL